MAVKFKAGRYYVGDLCYVMNRDEWDELLELSGDFGDKLGSDQWFGYFKGFQVFAAFTADGDGVYFDNEGREYVVDDGLIGIISADWVEGKEEEIVGLGHIIAFPVDFRVSADGGFFEFGEIVINTDVEEEDELEEEDE